jgi:UDP-N-acetylglucosamine--N-acetylmuramyl-(pentapeptide) pyrophosphoryl-undecaprenol N-acetylglucosamine transferase
MPRKVIISGGGTGGHIFPAVAIANALKKTDRETEILFVGANGRMEMEKVPASGYKIVGLDIQGFQRKSLLKNLALPVKLIKSILKARSVIKEFRPDAAVGVGGYASGPLLFAAGQMGIPCLIQEQNSYAGITNKVLARYAKRICVAFEGMERFFPAHKLLVTGNPVRSGSVDIDGKREEAAQFFGLESGKKTILITGGSLGAGTLNKSMAAGLEKITASGVQLLWQTGSYYYKDISARYLHPAGVPGVKIVEFIQRMDLAYALADVIVSRAGAGTIAELCTIGKPVILVPSPNVAEDHQTKNALSLVRNDAAVLVKDGDAIASLTDTALNLLGDASRSEALAAAIRKLALPHADEVIAAEVFRIMKGGNAR